MEKEERKQLQLRLGAKLIHNIDAAVQWLSHKGYEDAQDRTALVLNALQRRLESPKDRCCGATADVLFGNRKPFMVRVSTDLLEQIDTAADKACVSRTNWVIDAIVFELDALAVSLPELREYPYRECPLPSTPRVRATE